MPTRQPLTFDEKMAAERPVYRFVPDDDLDETYRESVRKREAPLVDQLLEEYASKRGRMATPEQRVTAEMMVEPPVQPGPDVQTNIDARNAGRTGAENPLESVTNAFLIGWDRITHGAGQLAEAYSPEEARSTLGRGWEAVKGLANIAWSPSAAGGQMIADFAVWAKNLSGDFSDGALDKERSRLQGLLKPGVSSDEKAELGQRGLQTQLAYVEKLRALPDEQRLAAARESSVLAGEVIAGLVPGGYLAILKAAGSAAKGARAGSVLRRAEQAAEAAKVEGGVAARAEEVVGKAQSASERAREAVERLEQLAVEAKKAPELRPIEDVVEGAKATATTSDVFELASRYQDDVRRATRGEELSERSGMITKRLDPTRDVEAARLLEEGVITPERVRDFRPGTTLNDAEAIAMARTLTEIGVKTKTLAEVARTSGYTKASVDEFLKEIYLLGQLDPKRIGAIAEAGRAERALADPVSGMNNFLNQFTRLFQDAKSTRRVEKMIDQVAMLQSPEQFARFAKDATKPGMWDYWSELWINSLLSGPKTWGANAIGNTVTLAWTIGERGLAGTLSRGAEGAVAKGEATAMLHGVVMSFVDGLRAFGKIQAGADVARVSDLGKAGKTELVREAAISAKNVGLTGTAGSAVDLIGSVIRTPSRVLDGTDEFFKTISSRAEIYALARREGFHEAQRLGLTGDAFAQKVREVERALIANPPASALRKGREFAEYITFTNDLGEAGALGLRARDKLQVLGGIPVGRVAVPFMRTPINIFKFAGERLGPLGLASARVRAELRSTDLATRQLARAKLSMSSASLAAFSYLAAEGYVTGGGPSDPVLRKQMKDAGWAPYSVWFDWNGDGKYDTGELVSYNRLDPIGMILGTAADMAQLAGHVGNSTFDELAVGTASALARNFSSKTFVRGLAEIAGAISNPDRNAAVLVQNLVSSLIPGSSLLRQIEGAVDPEMQDVRSTLDRVMSGIPGLSQSVAPDLDLFGNQRYLGGGLGRDLVPPAFKPAVDLFSPIYVNSASKAHLRIFQTLLDHNVRTPEPPDKIEGIRLSGEERADLIRLAGGKPVEIRDDIAGARSDVVVRVDGLTMPEQLARLFTTARWKASDDDGKQALVGTVVSRYYDRAKTVLPYKYPELDASVKAARIRKAEGSARISPEQAGSARERLRSRIQVR